MTNYEGDIETILYGPGYFYCVKANCRLRLAVCIKRQEENSAWAGFWADCPFPICVDCLQGKHNHDGLENMKPSPDDTSEVVTEKRICIECNERHTISPRAPYCAKCMAARGNRKRKEMALQKDEAPSSPIQADRSGYALTLNFGTHGHILEAITEIAKTEMRPLEMQIIFILKRHLEGLQTPLKAASNS